MSDHLSTFIKHTFEQFELHEEAHAVYSKVKDGYIEALYRLSRYLADRGCVVIIDGTQVTARAAGSRGRYPARMIFDLRGGDVRGIGGVANSVRVSTYNVCYYLDSEASQELEQQESRYVLADDSEKPSDRTEAEDTMLRDRQLRSCLE